MKKILWISKHPPLLKQIQELNRRFGTVEIIQYAGFVIDANHVKQLILKYQADDVVTILPLTMIQKLCELGIKPIYPKIRQVSSDPCDYTDKSGRKYVFEKFVRVLNVKMITEDLK